MSQVKIKSESKTQVINVTRQLADLVEGVDDGIALFSVPHTTAAIIISEDDKELREDFLKVANTWLNPLKPFKHIRKNNPNTEAHVLSSFAGTSVSVGISDGKLDLGTYQNLLLLELDGPKERRINCKLLTAGKIS